MMQARLSLREKSVRPVKGSVEDVSEKRGKGQKLRGRYIDRRFFGRKV